MISCALSPHSSINNRSSVDGIVEATIHPRYGAALESDKSQQSLCTLNPAQQQDFEHFYGLKHCLVDLTDNQIALLQEMKSEWNVIKSHVYLSALTGLRAMSLGSVGISLELEMDASCPQILLMKLAKLAGNNFLGCHLDRSVRESAIRHYIAKATDFSATDPKLQHSMCFHNIIHLVPDREIVRMFARIMDASLNSSLAAALLHFPIDDNDRELRQILEAIPHSDPISFFVDFVTFPIAQRDDNLFRRNQELIQNIPNESIRLQLQLVNAVKFGEINVFENRFELFILLDVWNDTYCPTGGIFAHIWQRTDVAWDPLLDAKDLPDDAKAVLAVNPEFYFEIVDDFLNDMRFITIFVYVCADIPESENRTYFEEGLWEFVLDFLQEQLPKKCNQHELVEFLVAVLHLAAVRNNTDILHRLTRLMFATISTSAIYDEMLGCPNGSPIWSGPFGLAYLKNMPSQPYQPFHYQYAARVIDRKSVV